MKGRVFSRREPGERSWRFGWAEEVFIHGVERRRNVKGQRRRRGPSLGVVMDIILSIAIGKCLGLSDVL